MLSLYCVFLPACSLGEKMQTGYPAKQWVLSINVCMCFWMCHQQQTHHVRHWNPTDHKHTHTHTTQSTGKGPGGCFLCHDRPQTRKLTFSIPAAPATTNSTSSPVAAMCSHQILHIFSPYDVCKEHFVLDKFTDCYTRQKRFSLTVANSLMCPGAMDDHSREVSEHSLESNVSSHLIRHG